MIFKTTKKTKNLAMLIAIVFTLQSSIEAAPLSIVSSPASTLPVRFAESLSVPASIGSVQERFLSKDNTSSFVIQIQDAHGQPEAQHHIQELIDYLVKNYGAKTIAVESAFSKIEPQLLHIFKDKKLNKEFAETLVQMGEVTGVELFAMENTDTSVEVVGAEDPKLYNESFLLYQKIQNAQDAWKPQLEQYQKTIEHLQMSIFQGALREYFLKQLEWRQQRENSLEYLLLIRDYAKKYLNIDLNDARNQFEWPALVRLMTVKNLESRLNIESAYREKESLLKALDGLSAKKKPAKEYFTSKIQALFAPSKVAEEFSLQTDLFPEIKSTRDFFEALQSETKGAIELLRYPNFLDMAGSYILREELDATALIEELDKIEKKIQQSLVQTKGEKEVLELSYGLELLKKLFSLHLTKEDYLLYTKQKLKLRAEEFLKRIDSFSEILLTRHEVKPFSQVLIDDAEKFYELSLKRDQTLIENTLTHLNTRGGKAPIILIAGGFHADGVSKALQTKDISHVIISPRMSEVADEMIYRNAMLGQNLPYEIATIGKLLYAQDALSYGLGPLSLGQRQLLLVQALREFFLSQEVASEDLKGITEEIRSGFSRIGGENFSVAFSEDKHRIEISLVDSSGGGQTFVLLGKDEIKPKRATLDRAASVSRAELRSEPEAVVADLLKLLPLDDNLENVEDAIDQIMIRKSRRLNDYKLIDDESLKKNGPFKNFVRNTETAPSREILFIEELANSVVQDNNLGWDLPIAHRFAFALTVFDSRYFPEVHQALASFMSKLKQETIIKEGNLTTEEYIELTRAFSKSERELTTVDHVLFRYAINKLVIGIPRREREAIENEYNAEQMIKELENPGSGDVPNIVFLTDLHGSTRLGSLIAYALGIENYGEIYSVETLEERLFEQWKKENPSAERVKTVGEIMDEKNIVVVGGSDYVDRGPKPYWGFLFNEWLRKHGKLRFINGNHDLWKDWNVVGFHLIVNDILKNISKSGRFEEVDLEGHAQLLWPYVSTLNLTEEEIEEQKKILKSIIGDFLKIGKVGREYTDEYIGEKANSIISLGTNENHSLEWWSREWGIHGGWFDTFLDQINEEAINDYIRKANVLFQPNTPTQTFLKSLFENLEDASEEVRRVLEPYKDSVLENLNEGKAPFTSFDIREFFKDSRVSELKKKIEGIKEENKLIREQNQRAAFENRFQDIVSQKTVPSAFSLTGVMAQEKIVELKKIFEVINSQNLDVQIPTSEPALSTEKNYRRNPQVMQTVLWNWKNFRLVYVDALNNIALHGIIPFNLEDLDFAVTYQTSSGQILRGLNAIERIQYDVRKFFDQYDEIPDNAEFRAKMDQEIGQAMRILNHWYSDTTAELKPEKIQAFLESGGPSKYPFDDSNYSIWGDRVFRGSEGVWMLGHVESAKLRKAGISYWHGGMKGGLLHGDFEMSEGYSGLGAIISWFGKDRFGRRTGARRFGYSESIGAYEKEIKKIKGDIASAEALIRESEAGRAIDKDVEKAKGILLKAQKTIASGPGKIADLEAKLRKLKEKGESISDITIHDDLSEEARQQIKPFIEGEDLLIYYIERFFKENIETYQNLNENAVKKGRKDRKKFYETKIRRIIKKLKEFREKHVFRLIERNKKMLNGVDLQMEEIKAHITRGDYREAGEIALTLRSDVKEMIDAGAEIQATLNDFETIVEFLERLELSRNELRSTAENSDIVEEVLTDLKASTSLIDWAHGLKKLQAEAPEKQLNVTLHLARGIQLPFRIHEDILKDRGLKEKLHRFLAAQAYNAGAIFGTDFVAIEMPEVNKKVSEEKGLRKNLKTIQLFLVDFFMTYFANFMGMSFWERMPGFRSLIAGLQRLDRELNSKAVISVAEIENLLKNDLGNIREAQGDIKHKPYGIGDYANAGKAVSVVNAENMDLPQQISDDFSPKEPIAVDYPGLFLGIDIGGNSAKFGLISDGNFIELPEHLQFMATNMAVKESPEAYMNRLATQSKAIADWARSANLGELEGVGVDMPGVADIIKNEMVTIGQISSPENKDWTSEQIVEIKKIIPTLTRELNLDRDDISRGIIRNDMDGVLTGVLAVLSKLENPFLKLTAQRFRFDWMGTGHGFQFSIGMPLPAPTEGGHVIYDFGSQGSQIYDTESETTIPRLIQIAIDAGFPREELIDEDGKFYMKPLGDELLKGAAESSETRYQAAYQAYRSFAKAYAKNLVLGFELAELTKVVNASQVLLGGGIVRGATGEFVKSMVEQELEALGYKEEIKITLFTEDEIESVVSKSDFLGSYGAAALAQQNVKNQKEEKKRQAIESLKDKILSDLAQPMLNEIDEDEIESIRDDVRKGDFQQAQNTLAVLMSSFEAYKVGSLKTLHEHLIKIHSDLDTALIESRSELRSEIDIATIPATFGVYGNYPKLDMQLAEGFSLRLHASALPFISELDERIVIAPYQDTFSLAQLPMVSAQDSENVAAIQKLRENVEAIKTFRRLRNEVFGELAMRINWSDKKAERYFEQFEDLVKAFLAISLMDADIRASAAMKWSELKEEFQAIPKEGLAEQQKKSPVLMNRFFAQMRRLWESDEEQSISNVDSLNKFTNWMHSRVEQNVFNLNAKNEYGLIDLDFLEKGVPSSARRVFEGLDAKAQNILFEGNSVWIVKKLGVHHMEAYANFSTPELGGLVEFNYLEKQDMKKGNILRLKLIRNYFEDLGFTVEAYRTDGRDMKLYAPNALRIKLGNQAKSVNELISKTRYGFAFLSNLYNTDHMLGDLAVGYEEFDAFQNSEDEDPVFRMIERYRMHNSDAQREEYANRILERIVAAWAKKAKQTGGRIFFYDSPSVYLEDPSSRHKWKVPEKDDFEREGARIPTTASRGSRVKTETLGSGTYYFWNGEVPYSDLHTEAFQAYSKQIHKALQLHLRTLGLHAMPPYDAETFGQMFIDQHYNEPIVRGLKTEQLIWDSGKLQRNKAYEAFVPEVEFVNQWQKTPEEMALMGSYLHKVLLNLEPIGEVGDANIEIGEFSFLNASITVTVARRNADGRVIAATVYSHDQGYLSPSEVYSILKQNNVSSRKVPNISVKSLKRYARTNDRIFKALSSNDIFIGQPFSGQPFLTGIQSGRIVFDLEEFTQGDRTRENKGLHSGEILFAKSMEDDDLRALKETALNGIVTQQGVQNSHINTSAKSVGKPRVNLGSVTISPDDQWLIKERKPAPNILHDGYRIRLASPESREWIELVEGDLVTINGNTGMVYWMGQKDEDLLEAHRLTTELMKFQQDVELGSSQVALSAEHFQKSQENEENIISFVQRMALENKVAPIQFILQQIYFSDFNAPSFNEVSLIHEISKIAKEKPELEKYLLQILHYSQYRLLASFQRASEEIRISPRIDQVYYVLDQLNEQYDRYFFLFTSLTHLASTALNNSEIDEWMSVIEQQFKDKLSELKENLDQSLKQFEASNNKDELTLGKYFLVKRLTERVQEFNRLGQNFNFKDEHVKYLFQNHRRLKQEIATQYEGVSTGAQVLVPFSEIDIEFSDIVGNKAANLGWLNHFLQWYRGEGFDGVELAPGFGVSNSAFQAYLNMPFHGKSGIEGTTKREFIGNVLNTTLTAKEKAREIKKAFQGAELNGNLKKAVQTLIEENAKGKAWAIRSSTTVEDRPDDAAAGLFRSNLGPNDEATILAALEDTWSSFFSERAIAYRQEHLQPGEFINVNDPQGAIIQELVDADVAGVTTSASMNDRTEIITEAGYGLGISIVDATQDADSWVYHKTTRLIDDSKSRLGLKRKKMVYDAENSSVRKVSVGKEEREAFSLDKKMVLKISRLVAEIERWYGYVVQVEWAVKDDILYVKQVRPMPGFKITPKRKSVIDRWLKDEAAKAAATRENRSVDSETSSGTRGELRVADGSEIIAFAENNRSELRLSEAPLSEQSLQELKKLFESLQPYLGDHESRRWVAFHIAQGIYLPLPKEMDPKLRNELLNFLRYDLFHFDGVAQHLDVASPAALDISVVEASLFDRPQSVDGHLYAVASNLSAQQNAYIHEIILADNEQMAEDLRGKIDAETKRFNDQTKFWNLGDRYQIEIVLKRDLNRHVNRVVSDRFETVRGSIDALTPAEFAEKHVTFSSHSKQVLESLVSKINWLIENDLDQRVAVQAVRQQKALWLGSGVDAVLIRKLTDISAINQMISAANDLISSGELDKAVQLWNEMLSKRHIYRSA